MCGDKLMIKIIGLHLRMKVRLWAVSALLILSVILNPCESKPVNANVPMVEKRLLGIFRCSGWGPGCSRIKHKAPSAGETAELTDYDRGELIIPNALRAGRDLFENNGRSEEDTRWGSKKVPIYTLTSGLSWGPSGKRSSPFKDSVGRPKWRIPDQSESSENNSRDKENFKLSASQKEFMRYLDGFPL